MPHLNVELKAKCRHVDRVKKILDERGAILKGIDKQVDTYFKVSRGRLKLREGNIENFLIFYEREDELGPKVSKVSLLKNAPDSELKVMLTNSLGILVTVNKLREIYFVDNIKFHIDWVGGLGVFVEIEAIDSDGSLGKNLLTEQCREYSELFCISGSDLIRNSYSDLLLARNH